ncbi:uncharacterized protein PFL1_06261 [Pseudozyma flocculosa PF-1]|uniref:Uncharacterized protein n=1 Tax=Pseudozyma flocculosa PF-1 TaxID=1277687 RepID=A0A061H0W9_9BASI|nr:uncharacterized protein PFL1_06261 [Pseudozyma flocculosa PF-1]EPQ26052.1 hypothetical protein PFL1_06261 [Pseudozyma flocculosa PF-1]
MSTAKYATGSGQPVADDKVERDEEAPSIPEGAPSLPPRPAWCDVELVLTRSDLSPSAGRRDPIQPSAVEDLVISSSSNGTTATSTSELASLPTPRERTSGGRPRAATFAGRLAGAKLSLRPRPVFQSQWTSAQPPEGMDGIVDPASVSAVSAAVASCRPRAWVAPSDWDVAASPPERVRRQDGAVMPLDGPDAGLADGSQVESLRIYLHLVPSSPTSAAASTSAQGSAASQQQRFSHRRETCSFSSLGSGGAARLRSKSIDVPREMTRLQLTSSSTVSASMLPLSMLARTELETDTAFGAITEGIMESFSSSAGRWVLTVTGVQQPAVGPRSAGEHHEGLGGGVSFLDQDANGEEARTVSWQMRLDSLEKMMSWRAAIEGRGGRRKPAYGIAFAFNR